KEFLESDPHQPQALRRIERAERRSQADIDSEHAADPDNSAECVQGESEGSHERGSRFEAFIIGCWHDCRVGAAADTSRIGHLIGTATGTPLGSLLSGEPRGRFDSGTGAPQVEGRARWLA